MTKAISAIDREALRRAWPQERLERVSQDLEGRPPQEVLAWAFKEFSPRITLACSFGGISGMALLDMAVKINPAVRVFYLDTDYLFPETYQLRDEAIRRYGIRPEGFKSLLTTKEQAQKHGEALWGRDPDLCCQLRKVEPNGRAMASEEAWIAGLRRDQGETRKSVGIVEWDSQFQLVKINPLATWTEAQVWDYIIKNQVPYNTLHDRGYPSLGCYPCTKAVAPGADSRSGRWVGFEKTECGIHTSGSPEAEKAS
ncbi:MAG: phosphoadenylyl-sulfate reductase [Chloroflexi bacterium]|nr:phosphoadenylyl-sulfate reductase [Chloroflexota bacterium]